MAHRHWKTHEKPKYFVKPTYVETLRDDQIRFKNVSAMDITNHFYNTYGDIDEIYLEQNNVEMIKPMMLSIP